MTPSMVHASSHFCVHPLETDYITPQEHALPQPASMASVHPSLRNVLDIPESASPRPRPGMNAPRGPTRERRIPGPPPPQSWLLQSKHARKEPKTYTDEERTIHHQSVKLPGAYLLDERSLQHAIVKALAINWNWHAENDYFSLVLIPTRLRETLLSYVSIFAAGDTELAGQPPLHILFPVRGSAQSSMGLEERQEVTRLDLTGALGIWLSWLGLRKALLVTESTPRQPVPQSFLSNSANDVAQDIPDSWEDGEGSQNQTPMQPQSVSTSGIPKSIHILAFPNLRHLSLALEPNSVSSDVSWSSLLGVASHLHTLESLSLAYWPLPTYTPAAAATFATISSNLLGTQRRIAYGGTNMYSAQENDWRESSGILRSLSRSLYCLKWLDLTGCVTWLPALIWEDNTLLSTPDDGFGPLSDKTEEELPVSIWNGYWRGIVWLGLGVGWTPSSGSDNRAASTALARDYNKLRSMAENVAKQVWKSRIGKGQHLFIELGEIPDGASIVALP